MDASWNAFTRSLIECPLDESGGFTTEYEYPLVGDIVGDVVTEGITDLISNAAYLLAFNDKIRSLPVELPSRSVTIEKKSCRPLAEDAQLLHVEERIANNAPVSRYVALITNNDTYVAIEISAVEDTEQLGLSRCGIDNGFLWVTISRLRQLLRALRNYSTVKRVSCDSYPVAQLRAGHRQGQNFLSNGWT
jgi:hypothetical protein